jgi:hypothetical protein
VELLGSLPGDQPCCGCIVVSVLQELIQCGLLWTCQEFRWGRGRSVACVLGAIWEEVEGRRGNQWKVSFVWFVVFWLKKYVLFILEKSGGGVKPLLWPCLLGGGSGTLSPSFGLEREGSQCLNFGTFSRTQIWESDAGLDWNSSSTTHRDIRQIISSPHASVFSCAKGEVICHGAWELISRK